MLKEGPLPKAQREVKVFYKIKDLKQRNNQSVADFLAHYQTIEDQLESPFEDKVSRMLIVTGVHKYFVEALRMRETRLEMEENLQDIERVKKPPPGITVAEAYKVTQADSGDTKDATAKGATKTGLLRFRCETLVNRGNEMDDYELRRLLRMMTRRGLKLPHIGGEELVVIMEAVEMLGSEDLEGELICILSPFEDAFGHTWRDWVDFIINVIN